MSSTKEAQIVESAKATSPKLVENTQHKDDSVSLGAQILKKMIQNYEKGRTC